MVYSFLLVLKRFTFNFTCIFVVPVCGFLSCACLVPPQPEKGIQFTGTGVTVVSHHVGTRNQIWVLEKRSQCSNLLNYHSSPKVPHEEYFPLVNKAI